MAAFPRLQNLLDLSQPAISAQIKRLQKIVGCEVFRHSHSGVALTERGRLILSHAKRMLEENDQIFALGGRTRLSKRPGWGFPTLYAQEFFKNFNAENFSERITISCGHSNEIVKSLADGYLDVACVLNHSKDAGELDNHWGSEDFAWVRSRNFVISPGNPDTHCLLAGESARMSRRCSPWKRMDWLIASCLRVAIMVRAWLRSQTALELCGYRAATRWRCFVVANGILFAAADAGGGGYSSAEGVCKPIRLNK